MNGIEKITARIESDGRAETEAILREAREKADAVRAAYEAQVRENARQDAQAASAAAEQRRQRMASAAEMDARKLVLAAKQSCLDEAFALAEKKLTDLDDGKYAELLARIAVSSARTGREEIILSAGDRKRAGEQMIASANAGREGAAFRLSRETREMDGGLVLKDGSVEINCAFGTLLRFLRESMAAEVAAILFPAPKAG